MKSQEILDIILKLNSELYEQTTDELIYLNYNYITNGLVLIEFLDYPIWNSEDDQRKYLNDNSDQQEDLETYLRREVNQIINIISKICVRNKMWNKKDKFYRNI